MNLSEHLPVLVVINFFVFAFLMPVLFSKAKRWCGPAALFSLCVSVIFSVILLLQVMETGPFTYHVGGWAPPFGIELRVDYLSVYMLLVLTGVGLVVLAYGFVDLLSELKERVIGWYYTLYLLLIGSMVGMALTNDLFNLFVFMEICAIAACAIISIKENRECLEASFKYLILSAMGTGCYLLAVALIYMITGHLNFDMVREVLTVNAGLYPHNVLAALALIMVAIGVKAALFPLHVWLPDAHASAPSPSSAVLSGLVIKIYAIALINLAFKVFPRDMLIRIPLMEVVLWLATLSVIFGSVFAMTQQDFKKMLAYSSIAQIGYVFMGVGLFSRTALTGGLVHILNHAIMKAMLFMVAGIIIYCAGIRKIKDFSGIGSRLSFTMIAFTVGGLSMVGIPLTGGFIGKLFLIQGSFETGRYFFGVIILLSSLLNAVYYFPIAISAFWGEPDEERPPFKPVPPIMTAALSVMILAVFILGVYPRPVTLFLHKAVDMLFGYGL